MTPDSVIDALGGTSEVAQTLRVAPAVVSNWRSRKAIPAKKWAELVAMAADRGASGITFETLGTMHARAEPAGAAP